MHCNENTLNQLIKYNSQPTNTNTKEIARVFFFLFFLLKHFILSCNCNVFTLLAVSTSCFEHDWLFWLSSRNLANDNYARLYESSLKIRQLKWVGVCAAARDLLRFCGFFTLFKTWIILHRTAKCLFWASCGM